VEAEQILSLMRPYFEREQPERLQELEQSGPFPDLRAADLLEDSTDVVTFVFYLEDGLGREIKLHQVGPELTSMTFRDLADKLGGMVAAKP
jgi:hypothetical protein